MIGVIDGTLVIANSALTALDDRRGTDPEWTAAAEPGSVLRRGTAADSAGCIIGAIDVTRVIVNSALTALYGRRGTDPEWTVAAEPGSVPRFGMSLDSAG